MEGSQSKVSSISIQPRNVFGLQTKVRGNIHFTTKQEVIYPVAGVLAIHDYTINKQKFLRFPEKCHPEIIVMSQNRKLLAIAERNEKSSFVNIYDLLTLKKRKTLTLPTDFPSSDVCNLCFTFDSKGIAVLSQEPDAFLAIFYFDKNETIVTGRVSNRNQKGVARYLACNPSDSGLVAIGGDYTFKLMNKTDKGFTLLGNIKTENLIITSLAWLTPDILVAGTSTTELFFIEGGEAKVVFNATHTDIIDLEQEHEETEKSNLNEISCTDLKSRENLDVNCLTQFSKGFGFSVHNIVYIFEKETNFRYIKKTIITIQIDIYSYELYKIANIAINAQQDTIIASTVHSQIYIGMLFVPETLKAKEFDFKTLGEPLHIGGIIGLSVCSWKPIIMTASKDQTIRIWNYNTGKIELVKKYQVDITVIGLHPSGIFVAVGFSDQLRLMEILLDDLKITKTFNFPKCTDAVFSHQGHTLAASYDNQVTIVSVFSFDILRTFKGHNGLVLSLCWSVDDNYLVSAGMDGAVYEWEVATGNRINEVVLKGTEYRDLAITNDKSVVYSVTNTGILRELAHSDIVRDIKPSENVPLTCIALSRSDFVLFIASEKGHLYNVQVPFLETDGGKCTNYRFFQSAITKMKITYDDSLLATVSADGTLVIWTILNNEGKKKSMDSELGKCVDVLIPRKDLIEKIDTIASLELRIEQQLAEFQYQLRQGDVFHSEKMRDIHKNYCDAIDELQAKNTMMEAQHIEEFNIITGNIAKTNEEHNKALLDLETVFHEKIIIEYEKSANIKTKMDVMREDYEQKLRKSAGCLQDTIDALESDFKKQLQERQELIRQLMKEMESKKSEFVEYCKQVEIDNDRNMVESQLRYEKLLKDEQEISIKWRGEAGVLKKKFITITNDCEDLREDIQNLRAEHKKYQKKIRGYEKDIDDLKKEIDERDQGIRNKEKRVNELSKINQELEKYKQALKHKISELEAQIEPREHEIKDKKDQIVVMEKELEVLQQKNLKLELQLSEVKDKYHGTDVELKVERTRSRTARAQISRICGDIYKVSGQIQKPNRLKSGVKNLYHRYGDDTELKKSLALDAEVQSEFLRQREHLERLASGNKSKLVKKKTTEGDIDKLIKENVVLISELNKIRAEFKETQKMATHMESILGISGKFIPSSEARQKLAKAVADYDEIERKHQNEYERLDNLIKTLTNENQLLRTEMIEITKRLPAHY